MKIFQNKSALISVTFVSPHTVGYEPTLEEPYKARFKPQRFLVVGLDYNIGPDPSREVDTVRSAL